MAKVLVTGATGLLGSELVPFLQQRGHQVTTLGYSHAANLNADLAHAGHTAHALNQARPDTIINLVALTHVDRCESHPQEAYLLNVKPVENLCAWIKAADHPCHLLQISSDHVYDGAGPHAEDVLTIHNHYAMSKLAGEFVARTVHSTILRTNFVGRSRRKERTSFTDWLHGALCGQAPINVFDDVMFSPLAIATLCDCIERTVVLQPAGTFNLGSRDGMSKADFAFAFAVATGLPTTNLVRCSSGNADTLAARRPTDMRMLSERFEHRMGLALPRLIDEIKVLAHDYA